MNTLLPRSKRAAVAASSLALTTALVVGSSVGGLVEVTAAQSVDAETISIDGTVSWSEGGFARTMSNSITNHATYSAARNNVASTADPATANQVGTWGDEDLDGPATDSTFEIRTLGDRPGTAVNYCLQSAPPGATAAPQPECLPGGPEYTQEAQSRATSWGRSGGVANPTRDADQPTVFVEAGEVRTMVECSPTGEAWALVPSSFDPEWGQGIGITALAESATGAPTVSEFLALEPEENSRVSAWIPAQEITAPATQEAIADAPEISGTAETTPPTTAPDTIQPADSTFFHVSLTSRAFAVEGYALSDLYVTVDQYHHESKEYLGSFTMVFARSECGVKLGPIDHQPLATDFEAPDAPAYPTDPASEPVTISAAPVPDANGVEAVRSSRVTHRTSLTGESLSEPEPTTVVASSQEPKDDELVSTSASPLPDDDDNATTASSTTVGSTPRTTRTTTRVSSVTATSTSGLPSPGDSATQSPSVGPTITAGPTSTVGTTLNSSPVLPTTTLPTLVLPSPTPSPSIPPATPSLTPSTLTPISTPSPEIVIPDEPGTLSPRASTEVAGTFQLGIDKYVVVIRGDELPRDAEQGVDALETWLRGGDTGNDWSMFVSAALEDDGWQWAAISQKTGTVLYVR